MAWSLQAGRGIAGKFACAGKLPGVRNDWFPHRRGWSGYGGGRSGKGDQLPGGIGGTSTDTKGWGGHGCFIVLGAPSVDDVRRAVEMTLALIQKFSGEVHISAAGHLEFAYSARAGEALCQVFGAQPGQAFGFMAGSPAPIGAVMADRALKEACVLPVRVCTPSYGTSHSNEVILAISGDAEAVLAKRIGGKAHRHDPASFYGQRTGIARYSLFIKR